MKTKIKIRLAIIFFLVLALFGTGLSLYGGNMIDYIRDHLKKNPLPMADIGVKLKNSSTYLVACGGIKVILTKEQLTQGYNLSNLKIYK